jgi:quinol monooxygenase YgiN
MSEQVYWIVDAVIKDGETEAFKALMAEMVAATEANEPDTLNYEWTIAADGSRCHIFERYANSAAVVTHLKWFGAECAERFMALAKPEGFTVYGNPDATAKKMLDGVGAVYFTPIGGFSR